MSLNATLAALATALDDMKLEEENGDEEAAHENADAILLRVIRTLPRGDELAESFLRVEKWYS